MSDPLSIMAMIKGGVDVASDVFNMGSQIMTNAQNTEFAKLAMAREDTAVQRRVADLKAAGLSPVLAAGSAASTQAPIRLTAPQADLGRGFGSYLQTQSIELAQKKASAEIEQTKKQNELLELQKQKSQLDIEFARENNPTKIQSAQIGLELQAGTVMKKINQEAEKMNQAQINTTLKMQETDIKALEIRIKDAEAKRQDMLTAKMVADTAFQTAKTAAVATGTQYIAQKMAQNEFYIKLLKKRVEYLMEGNPFGNLFK